MADKPSRALVIFGDGIAPLVLPSHGSLHSFASRAACGFLALRASPPSEAEDERIVRDLAQLLDAYDFYISEDNAEAIADSNCPTLSERFMGLKAAMVTSCPSIKSFARKLGFSILQESELIKPDSSTATLHSVSNYSDIVSKLLHHLGFSGKDILEKYDFDLLFLHIMTHEKPANEKENLVNGLNDLVGGVMEKAHPGSIIGSRLHLSIVLSYGHVSECEKDCFLLSSSPLTDSNSDLTLLRPCQSYTIKGGHRLNGIRHHHPMLMAQWQEGVTRRDKAKVFSFEEFKEALDKLK